jgi:hypothetical protein
MLSGRLGGRYLESGRIAASLWTDMTTNLALRFSRPPNKKANLLDGRLPIYAQITL